MVYPEEEEGDDLRLPLSPVGQRGYGLDRNRRSSAEDFGSTSEEDEMVLHPLESVLKQIRDRSESVLLIGQRQPRVALNRSETGHR